jgi:hypothetical protein
MGSRKCFFCCPAPKTIIDYRAKPPEEIVPNKGRFDKELNDC